LHAAARSVEPLRELPFARQRGADVALERRERRGLDAEPTRFGGEIRGRRNIGIEHETRGCDQRCGKVGAQRCDARIVALEPRRAIEVRLCAVAGRVQQLPAAQPCGGQAQRALELRR